MSDRKAYKDNRDKFFSVFKYFEMLLFTKRRLIRQKNCVGY